MRVNGHLYPPPHPAWGTYSEELFFYTSRYFNQALQQMQKTARIHSIDLDGYHASELSDVQRFVLAWMLSAPPTARNMAEVLHTVEKFHQIDREIMH